MKKLKYLIIMLVLTVFTVPITISASEKEKNYFYIQADNDVVLEEEVSGSALIAGNNVEANAKINGIGFLFGNNIDVSKNSDYLITAGNNITIDSQIENDAFIAGNIVTLSENAIINRDLIIVANEVNIYGEINRNVKIYAAKVNMKGSKVGGKAELTVESLNIDENTIIVGHLSYNEDAKATIDSKSIASISTYEDKEFRQTFTDIVLDNAIAYTGMLVVFLVLALIAPKIFEKIKNGMDSADATTPFKLFVIGFFSLIIVPFISVLLFISTIGVTLGFLSIALYIISICTINVFISYIIGRLVLTKLFKQEENTLLSGFIGMVILFVLSLIPYVSTVVTFISLFVGLGIIFSLIKPQKK